MREEWGTVQEGWGAIREGWGAVREECGTTCLLSVCTWYEHLGNKNMEQGRYLCVPLRDSGYIGLDLGVHNLIADWLFQKLPVGVLGAIVLRCVGGSPLWGLG